MDSDYIKAQGETQGYANERMWQQDPQYMKNKVIKDGLISNITFGGLNQAKCAHSNTRLFLICLVIGLILFTLADISSLFGVEMHFYQTMPWIYIAAIITVALTILRIALKKKYIQFAIDEIGRIERMTPEELEKYPLQKQIERLERDKNDNSLYYVSGGLVVIGVLPYAFFKDFYSMCVFFFVAVLFFVFGWVGKFKAKKKLEEQKKQLFK